MVEELRGNAGAQQPAKPETRYDYDPLYDRLAANEQYQSDVDAVSPALFTLGGAMVGVPAVKLATSGGLLASASPLTVSGGAMLGMAGGVFVLAGATALAIGAQSEINQDFYDWHDLDTSRTFAQSWFRGEVAGEKPSIGNYRNLPGALAAVSRHMNDAELSAPMERHLNGTFKRLDQLDLSDPRNMRAFERALDTETNYLRQLQEQNDSVFPRWMRSSESLLRHNTASIALIQIESARKELGMYKAAKQRYDEYQTGTDVEAPRRSPAAASHDVVSEGGIKGGPDVSAAFQATQTGAAPRAADPPAARTNPGAKPLPPQQP